MNKLIYGKNSLERVVCVQPLDDYTEVFIENQDGTTSSQFLPNRYWILSSSPLNKSFSRLKGDLHYKYGKQFKSREEFLEFKNRNRKEDTFSIYDSKESFLVKDGVTYFKGMKPEDVSILSFDIETSGLVMDDNSKIYMISNTFRKQGKIVRKLFSFDEYDSEAHMLLEWAKWVRLQDPSLICGHNISSYDLPFIYHIASMNDITLDLGRDGSALTFEKYVSKFRVDQTRFYDYNKARIYGREIVDTYFLAHKYDIGKKYESYGLKKIIQQEGFEDPNRVFYDASKIRQNINDLVELKKIKAYAEFDADDSLKLFDLMIPSFFYSCQAVPKPFQSIIESATGSQLNAIMIRSYLQEGHSLPKATEANSFEGALSDGSPGIYKHIGKQDVASLYPNIMLQYEISDPVKDPNNNFFEMLKIFTEQRIKHKKLAKETGDKYYDDLQSTEKIFINSAYGLLGATGLLFNNPVNASKVTRIGREILQKAINWAEGKTFKVVNLDTDSISFCKHDCSPFSRQELDTLQKDLNSNFPERIRFEDDGYYTSGIVFKAKNYVFYDGVKIKSKGSALKDSKKEKALKTMVNSMVEHILKANFKDQQELYPHLQKIYNSYVIEVRDGIKNIQDWSSKKNISDKVVNAERTNEKKVLEALQGMEYSIGDRVYMYFDVNDNLKRVDQYANDYSRKRFYEKLYKSVLLFETVLPVKELFLNYSLKRNEALVKEVK